MQPFLRQLLKLWRGGSSSVMLEDRHEANHFKPFVQYYQLSTSVDNVHASVKKKGTSNQYSYSKKPMISIKLELRYLSCQSLLRIGCSGGLLSY